MALIRTPRGDFAAIGIEKDKPFKPDPRIKQP